MAEKAAKSIADMQEGDEDSESSAKEEEKAGDTEQDSDDESHKLKKLALAKLEDASEESLLSQVSFSCFLCRSHSPCSCQWSCVSNIAKNLSSSFGVLVFSRV